MHYLVFVASVVFVDFLGLRSELASSHALGQYAVLSCCETREVLQLLDSVGLVEWVVVYVVLCLLRLCCVGLGKIRDSLIHKAAPD